MENTCRLCGKNQHNVVAIFSEIAHSKYILLKILSILNMEITENDPLPKHACISCLGKIDFIWEFHEQCRAAQLELRKTFLQPYLSNVVIHSETSPTVELASRGIDPPASSTCQKQQESSPNCIKSYSNATVCRVNSEENDNTISYALSSLPGLGDEHTEIESSGTIQKILITKMCHSQSIPEHKIPTVELVVRGVDPPASSTCPKREESTPNCVETYSNATVCRVNSKENDNTISYALSSLPGLGNEHTEIESSGTIKKIDNDVLITKMSQTMPEYKNNNNGSNVITRLHTHLLQRSNIKTFPNTYNGIQPTEKNIPSHSPIEKSHSADDTLASHHSMSNLSSQSDLDMHDEMRTSCNVTCLQQKSRGDGLSNDDPSQHFSLSDTDQFGAQSDMNGRISSDSNVQPKGAEACLTVDLRTSSEQSADPIKYNTNVHINNTKPCTVPSNPSIDTAKVDRDMSQTLQSDSSVSRDDSICIVFNTTTIDGKETTDEVPLHNTSEGKVFSEHITAPTQPNNSSVHKDTLDSEQANFMCKFCGGDFPNNDEFSIHMKSHGSRPQSLQNCEKCGKRISNIKEHVLRCHKIKNIVCHICNKRFVSKHDLKSHSVFHSNDRPFTCEKCGKTFKRKMALKKHNTRLHEEEDHSHFKLCEVCGKSVHKNDYNRHIICCKGELKFKCDLCNKTFKHIQHLKLHIKTHSIERPFACSQCNKTFKIKYSLKTHMNTHVMSKKFQCTKCDKSFRTRKILDDHLLMHQGIRKYACQLCEKSFFNDANLHTHMTFHKEKTIQCSICGNKYFRKNMLQSHIKQHHSQ